MKKEILERGITLISLVITIIVLLILAGVSISMLTGNNGIVKNARESKLYTTFSTYKEEVNLYKTNKYTENTNFLESTLEASKSSLSYNTKKQNEEGDIKDIITTLNSTDIEKFEIIKGKLLINTKDVNEIKVAQSLDIQVNPYDITEEGELLSSEGNLLLVDETGTLKIPDTVTKIGEGAFYIDENVQEIESLAFHNQNKMTKINIPKGLKTIKSAFNYCSGITEINIPNTVEKIDEKTFYECRNLNVINIDKNEDSIPGAPWGAIKGMKIVNWKK